MEVNIPIKSQLPLVHACTRCGNKKVQEMDLFELNSSGWF